MRCAQCGQVNPISVSRCDCGYDLSKRPGAMMEESFFSKHEGTIGCLTFVVVAVLCMWVAGCFMPNKEPVKIMQKELSGYPEYSILVEDVEDGWFNNYITLKGTFRTEESLDDKYAEEEATEAEDPALKDAPAILKEIKRRYQVKDGMIRRYEPYVGMVVASKVKKGGKTEVTGIERASPPYYNYVGRRRYGYWSGPSWIFYPSYSYMYYGGSRGFINRGMYSSYRSHYSTNRPYYGSTSGGRTTYGPRGTATAKANPSFVNRYSSKTGSSYSRPGASSSKSSSSYRSSSSSSRPSTSSSRSTSRSGGFFSSFSGK